MALTLPFTMKDNYESKGITIIQDGEPMTEEEEKVYKCSDCDLWVTSTESCCEEEEEEELDKCGYTGGMIEDFDGCGDLVDSQDTNMLGNTSYCLDCYEKHETNYYNKNPIEEEEDDETTIQYRKEMEEGCPEGYETIWNEYGFKYVEKTE